MDYREWLKPAAWVYLALLLLYPLASAARRVYLKRRWGPHNLYAQRAHRD